MYLRLGEALCGDADALAVALAPDTGRRAILCVPPPLGVLAAVEPVLALAVYADADGDGDAGEDADESGGGGGRMNAAATFAVAELL